ncbi:MAG: subtilisin-like serine protease [halophilic archaeon J07HX64]|jgi:Subtilisin-like serine proteases|nr:MAG: subtilisin-like serine protease [halophilic archaeon J07HX64]
MEDSSWSRRDILKSIGAGVLGIGVGAAVYHRMNEYIIGTESEGGAAAAASVSESGYAEIDLNEHTSTKLVCGVFSGARSESLAARDDVAFVQRDRKLTHVSDSHTGSQSATSAGTLPWGIDRIDADVAHRRGATGDGVDVGVIDTGISATHPDLSGSLADPEVDENHEAWAECSGGDCTYPWSDDGGHGTHVAGTVAAAGGEEGVIGVAPDATLHALKVCSGSGGCRTSAIVAAIRYAADRDWGVVNLSLGSPLPSPALKTAGEYAVEAGLVPVAAAGNRGAADSVGYPAAYEEYLAVSATDIDDELAGFSSRGPEVDLAAPGDSICSTHPDGHTVLSGTSMASPHVTGAVAQLLSQGHTPPETRQQLLDTAEDIGHPDTQQGEGLVDVAAALGYDSGDDGIGDGVSCLA